jgi:ribosomal-protein-serine acetyltransferase
MIFQMQRGSFPILLETERLYLKKLDLDHAVEILQCVDHDRQRLAEFLPWVERTKTLEDEHAYIAWSQEQWAKAELFDYAIFLKHTRAYVGNIGLHTISWSHRRCEIGYWIFSAFEGAGFLGEAVDRLSTETFRQGFHRLELRCSAHNLKSIRVARRCGFHYEALLKEDAVENGAFRSTFVFSKRALI